MYSSVGRRLASAEELTGMQLFGERESVVRGQRVTEPAVGSRAVRGLLHIGFVCDEARVLAVLNSVGVGEMTRRLFMQQREVVELPVELGGGIHARPAIPGLADDNLSNYTGSDDLADVYRELRFDGQVVDDRALKYKLNAVFRDTTMADKLQISSRRLQSAKRLALTDPSGAAMMLTEYIQSNGFPNARVLAGDYAKTVNNAIDFVHAMGRTISYRDVGAPAVISPKHMEMTFDQFHLKEPLWTVRGPLAYAREVNVVYQLALCHGPEHTLFMLATETIILGIDIRNEQTGIYYTGSVPGYSSMAGIQPLSSGFPSELTADQQTRLLIAGKKVAPVYAGDVVIGSAVYVSDKHAILNEHTLALAAQHEVAPHLAGLPIEESMSVAGDVCVVRRHGGHAQWLLRDPEVGERVVLCYSVGDSVEYSEVLQVVGCGDQLILSSSNVLRKGASGAAVIALRDSALLGIFSTMHASRVICALFSSSGFAIVSDCQSIAAVSQFTTTPGEDAGNRTYAKMVQRGLLGFLETISQSSASLYTVEHGRKRLAGLVTNVGGDWYTTVDPNVAQLVMGDGRMLAFRQSSFGKYSVVSPPPILSAVPNVRAVDPGERVFVFTKVGDDVVMSSVRMVTHCLVDNRGFVVEDFGESVEQVMGGMIVAERDAAVLGLYSGRECDAFGKYTVVCVSLVSSAIVSVPVVDVRAVFQELVEWIAPVDSVLRGYEGYGRSVWGVAVGRYAYRSGVAMSKAGVVGAGIWNERRWALLDTLGWPVDSGSAMLDRYRHDAITYAFLGLLYLHDGSTVMEKLAHFLDMQAVEVTPVVGEFPFPRPLSTGSVGSVRASSDYGDATRLRDLEEKVRALTEAVARETRSDVGTSDNG